MKKAICWIRRDLRIYDHRALYEACKEAEEVYVFFIFDPLILDRIKNKAPHRLKFMFDSLKKVDEELKKLNSRLHVLYDDPKKAIFDLCITKKINAVFCNHDYEPGAIARDQLIKSLVEPYGIKFLTFKDQVIFEKEEVLNKQKQVFKVFTPYKNAWLEKLSKNDLVDYKPNLARLKAFKEFSELDRFEPLNLQIKPNDITGFPAGTQGGKKQFNLFLKNLHQYDENRNFPYLSESTSKLSPHLRFGTLSIREIVREILPFKNTGAKSFLNELIWRDFYQMILANHPELLTKNFNRKYDYIQWPGKEVHFTAWCEAKTGYPIVDAAIEQLKQTGWMHNRLRMIVASFLTKDLLIDWRKGEEFFFEHLIDYELASNNGGWQWAASTGCDAQPYFRIFNPALQSKKFDSQGEFIKTYLPALKNVPEKYIHEPHLMPKELQLKHRCVLGKDYPNPIVDHQTQKHKALSLFKKA